MIKRSLLNVMGFVSYIGSPLIYIGMNYKIFTTTEAGTTISAVAVLGIIACLPVLRYFFKNFPIKPNWIGIAMVGFGLLARALGDVLMWIGVWSVGGSIVGDIAFKGAEKLKKNDADKKTAELIAKQMKEKNSV